MPATRPVSSRLLPLCIGLVLGAGCVLALRLAPASRSPADVTTSGSRSPAQHSGSPVAATLLLPPRLDTEEADEALAAYLALAPLPDKAAAAEIAPRLARLRALLTLLPAAHFEKLFATLATRVGGAEAKLRRLAFEVWAELDAPTAARWALAITPGEAINSGARNRYIHTAALAWAETDFPAAYAWACALSDAKLSGQLAGRLLAHRIAWQPAEALALARERGPEFFAAYRQLLFSAWARKDPVTALQTLGGDFKFNDFYQWENRQAIGAWFARDPRSAFDWLVARDSALPEGSDHNLSLLQSLSWSLASNPETARSVVELVAAHPELPDQATTLHQLVQSWTQHDPSSALAWIKATPDPERRAALLSSTLSYASKPEDFFAFVSELPESPARAQRIGDFVADWAGKDPAAALAWLETHPSPELDAAASRVQGALIARLAATDSAAALARWQALPPSDRIASAAPFAAAWSVNDPSATAAWLRPLIADPALSAQERQTLTRSYAGAVSRLADRDPEAGLRLAAATDDPDLRQTAYYALSNDYIATDSNLVPVTQPPERRAELLATIPDDQVREKNLSLLLGNWLRHDYPAASAWLETHDALSPETAARLLDQADPAKIRY